MSRDLPPGWVDRNAGSSCDEVVVNFDETETVPHPQPDLGGPHTGRWRHPERGDAIDYGLTGPNLRGSGVDYDLRKRILIWFTTS